MLRRLHITSYQGYQSKNTKNHIPSHYVVKPRSRHALLAIMEGVSKVLICYPRYEDERQRNSNTRECSHGSSSTSLLLLSRHGYCAPWPDAARQATVSLSAVPRRARAHISPGI